MERLWAPWRKAYLRPNNRPASKGCLFCRIAAEKKDAKNLILQRTPHSFAVLNLYPYTNGHLLVLPLRHVRQLAELTSAEKLDWLDLAETMRRIVAKKMKPSGFNLGVNLGRTAGAGIPKHLHLHVVPRWQGDHNFMPVLGGAKVISESLVSVYQTLKSELRKRSC